MKASEAIKLLQDAIEKHGDLTLYDCSPENGDYEETDLRLVKLEDRHPLGKVVEPYGENDTVTFYYPNERVFILTNYDPYGYAIDLTS
jgi:hypothetical protein